MEKISALLSAVSWSKRQEVVFFLGLLAFIILPVLLSSLGADVGNVILWLTGVVVLLYTVETHGATKWFGRMTRLFSRL